MVTWVIEAIVGVQVEIVPAGSNGERMNILKNLWNRLFAQRINGEELRRLEDGASVFGVSQALAFSESGSSLKTCTFCFVRVECGGSIDSVAASLSEVIRSGHQAGGDVVGTLGDSVLILFESPLGKAPSWIDNLERFLFAAKGSAYIARVVAERTDGFYGTVGYESRKESTFLSQHLLNHFHENSDSPSSKVLIGENLLSLLSPLAKAKILG